MQLKGFLSLFCPLIKMIEPALRIALEIPGIMNSIYKDKCVLKALLDAGYNLVNSKDPFSLEKKKDFSILLDH